MGEFRDRIGREAGFAVFGIDVHLDADVERRGAFGALLRQAARDLEAIDRMRPGEVGGDVARLVRLDVADEMPGDVVLRERLDLGERILQVVFAEVALTGIERGRHHGRRLGLADRHQMHIARVALVSRRRLVDATTDIGQPRGHVHGSRGVRVSGGGHAILQYSEGRPLRLG